MRKKVFIVGPTQGIAKLNLPEFEGAEAVLRKAGFIPVYVHQLFETDNQQEVLRPYADRVLCKEMMDCELVITLFSWEDDTLSSLLVSTARMYSITVQSIVAFIKEAAKT